MTSRLERHARQVPSKHHQARIHCGYMGVSWNRGTPKSSFSMGYCLINQLFWGTTMTMETPIFQKLDRWNSTNFQLRDPPSVPFFVSLRRICRKPCPRQQHHETYGCVWGLDLGSSGLKRFEQFPKFELNYQEANCQWTAETLNVGFLERDFCHCKQVAVW